MDKLAQIGFYTLSDSRAMTASSRTPLQRCELVLTDKCNFNCTYCRKLRPEARGHLDRDTALETVSYWVSERIKTVRFTGGEPLLHPLLKGLVQYCKAGKAEHIAVSSNGSFPLQKYADLIEAGVNDFSVSLDACCSQLGDSISRAPGTFDKVVKTIKFLGENTYVSVGMVFTEENVDQCREAVLFADSLGPSDIRVIPSAQFNRALSLLKDLPEEVLSKYPILRYRINHINEGRHIRGISPSDSNRCHLVVDDMASAGGMHFPCIIYLREGGAPIGRIGPGCREERLEWSLNHDTHSDPICKSNCLDCLVDYNNTAKE